jgi:type II secretory pathway component PulM
MFVETQGRPSRAMRMRQIKKLPSRTELEPGPRRVSILSYPIMAQPNFATIHQALVTLTNEVAFLPNLPAANQAQFAQNIQQLQQQNTQLNQNLNQGLAQINQTLAQINQNLTRIDQRLHNM